MKSLFNSDELQRTTEFYESIKTINNCYLLEHY